MAQWRTRAAGLPDEAMATRKPARYLLRRGEYLGYLHDCHRPTKSADRAGLVRHDRWHQSQPDLAKFDRLSRYLRTITNNRNRWLHSPVQRGWLVSDSGWRQSHPQPFTKWRCGWRHFLRLGQPAGELT